MAKIVCVGLACLDYLFKIKILPQGGGKFFADQYVAAPGGPAAAASIAVSSLDHDAVFIGRLGQDDVGKNIIHHLKARGVNTNFVRMIPDQSSQVSSVVVEETGERQIVNFSNAQLDPDPSWIPKDIIADADFLLTDVRWPEGSKRALEIARTYDIPSLIDADIAPIDISPLVNLAQYAVFSEKGLENMTGQKNIENSLKTVQKHSNAFVAVTVGEKGCYWLENNQIYSYPAPRIEAIDTCGAGDVFHGAFAVGMTEGMGVEAAIRFASATATLKCQTFGGSTGVPTRMAVDKFTTNHKNFS